MHSKDLQRYIECDCFASGEIRTSGDRLTKVAVKVLKEDVSREIREDFKHEVEIMSSFDHENILTLIGVMHLGEPFRNVWFVPGDLCCFRSVICL